MSNTTTYINFSSIDYKGKNSLSSYSLELTPFTFIPDISPTSTSRVVWDFGDGTTMTAFSASKYYKFPGVYYVNLIVYDCDTNAKISTFEKTITIRDYTPFTYNIQFYGYLISEDGSYIISEDGELIITEVSDNIKLKVGKIEGPLIFTTYYPPYQSTSNIYYSVSGSGVANYWNLPANKFNHLKRYHSFYKKYHNPTLSSYQFQEIPHIPIIGTDIYGKISNNVIVECLSTETDSKIIGRMGESSVYFKHDEICHNLRIDTWFDKTNNDIPFYNKSKVKYLNNLGISFEIPIIDNSPTSFSITSNGLDGEGYSIDTFKIHPIKFTNVDIPFVIKIKDSDHFTVKNFTKMPLSSINISLSGIGDTVLTDEDGEYLLDEGGNEIYANGTIHPIDTSTYTISSLNDSTISDEDGGFFRGYIRFNSLSTNVLQNISINAIATVTSDQLSSYTLSGSSNYFNLYNQNFYDFYKNNEDFNASENIKGLIFQESLIDKTVLFDNFIGGLLGDEDFDHQDIGLKIYEKIANFVDNTQNLDTCEIDFLNSISKYVGYNDVGEELYTYPEKIKRLVNLASMSKNSLIGELNKFNENFDIKGRTSKDVYGTNIGNRIHIPSYTIDANYPIVALEKFSNTYKLINTYQPINLLSSYNYPLSSFTSDWGWPLVLPSDFVVGDFEKYYLFFEYVDGEDNTPIGGVIDYTNIQNTVDRTVSSDSLYGVAGIFENMMIDTLYQSLSLIK